MKRIQKIIATMTVIILSGHVQANFAKVLLVKGKVSYLGPGMKTPQWVKNGMTFKEDTSIVTREKSFIKVRILDDGSSVSLGPESKMVVTKVKADKGSVISLLNGQLRSKVEKSKNLPKNESKLYIKTRTAALGVRGTEFIAIANQENHVTSLITLEGEVAMNKIDTSVPTTNIETQVREALDTTEQVTLVKKGNTATSYLHKEELTPVSKVNPVQLIALKKNEELTTAPTNQKELVEVAQNTALDEKTKKELYAPDEDGKIENIPENGGIVDLKSAIFIPEIKNDGVKIGNVDSNTGEFVPVAGIKLDEKKGFVVAQNNASKELQAKAKELNKMVDYKEVPKNFAPNHDVDQKSPILSSLSKDEKSHKLKTKIGLTEFIFKSKSNTSDQSSVAGLKIDINYIYTRPISNTINHQFEIGLKLIGLNKKDYENDQNKNLKGDPIGPRISYTNIFKIHHDVAFFAGLVYEHELLPVLSSNGSFESIGLITRTSKTLGYDYGLIYSYSAKTNIELRLHDKFESSSSGIKLDKAKGLTINADYAFERFKKHKFGISLDRTDYRYNGVNASSTSVMFTNNYKF